MFCSPKLHLKSGTLGTSVPLFLPTLLWLFKKLFIVVKEGWLRSPSDSTYVPAFPPQRMLEGFNTLLQHLWGVADFFFSSSALPQRGLGTRKIKPTLLLLPTSGYLPYRSQMLGRIEILYVLWYWNAAVNQSCPHTSSGRCKDWIHCLFFHWDFFLSKNECFSLYFY